MDSVSRPANRSPATKWSMCAGLYTFVCGIAVAFLLSDILGLLAEVLGFPAGYAMAVLASPALVIGAVVWWVVVERRETYTYLGGAAAGLLTALFTGVVWTARFVSAWGFEMLSAGPVAIIVAFVFGVVGVAGALTGLPLMYARRRPGGESGVDPSTG